MKWLMLNWGTMAQTPRQKGDAGIHLQLTLSNNVRTQPMTLPCNYPGEATNFNVFFEISLTSFGWRFELNKIFFERGPQGERCPGQECSLYVRGPQD